MLFTNILLEKCRRSGSYTQDAENAMENGR